MGGMRLVAALVVVVVAFCFQLYGWVKGGAYTSKHRNKGAAIIVPSKTHLRRTGFAAPKLCPWWSR